MTWFEWLQIIYSYCTSAKTVENWRPIAALANVAIAVAYFWIPIDMAIVFRRWRREIPFPWLWSGFALFIVACGVSHMAHALHALRQVTPYSVVELGIMVLTAAVSLVTAIGFTFVLPRIMALTAPSEVKKRLETEIEKATRDLEHSLETERVLLLEVHHRVKNNLQVTASLVGLHLRQLPLEHREPLQALRARITAMADIHNQLQEAGVRAFSAARFLEDLCKKLKIAQNREDISHQIVGEDLSVSFEQATPFSLIMNEVLTNIFRKAFGDGAGSKIIIAFKSDAGINSVSITNDGQVFVDDEEEWSVGTKLVNSLATQLDAQIVKSHVAGAGNVFTATFHASD